MSSEYIYDRKALVFKGSTCNYVALYCNTHSNNVDLHEPKWSLYGFEKEEDALRNPLQYAHYADSGVNRGPKGKAITGEYDIGKWREAIANARLSNAKISLRFSPKPIWGEHESEKIAKIFQHAHQMGMNVYHQNYLTRDFNGQQTMGTEIMLDMSEPKNVDLVWTITRDNSDPESKNASKSVLNAGDVLSLRNHCSAFGISFVYDEAKPVKTSKSSWVMNEKILKFEFPCEGSAYIDQRFAVIDWQQKVISTSPDYWFCREVLPALEKKEPGSAESAYKRFKAIMKALPVSDHEGMTIEVDATQTSEDLSRMHHWVSNARTALFARCLKPGFPQAYTDNPRDHIAALELSQFLTCLLALGNEDKSLNALSGENVEQLELLS